ncbi:MAG: MazG family protein [Gammaproteobacteria bacterium]|nr:MazG family protein [Gammaproteobacteria bacterium]
MSKKPCTGNGPQSVLDGVDACLPALAHAMEFQHRVAAVGFDWPQVSQVLEKIEEELQEIRHEIKQVAGHDRLEDEIGDLLFVCVNLARHMKVNPEAALQRANAKFERRFRRIEELLAQRGRGPDESNLEEMDDLWNQVKSEERA